MASLIQDPFICSQFLDEGMTVLSLSDNKNKDPFDIDAIFVASFPNLPCYSGISYMLTLMIYNTGYKDLGCQHESAYSRWRFRNTVEASDPQRTKTTG